jgi:hypothetical protein
MARLESDREDLLREATALRERAELTVEGFAEPVVVGFRRDGAGSVFLGAGPVYQFNAAHELRRAYRAGQLLKADQGRLVAMQRHRMAEGVELRSRELSATEAAEVLGALRTHLDGLQASLEAGRFRLLGQVPATTDVVARFRAWLAALPRDIVIARRPNVR